MQTKVQTKVQTNVPHLIQEIETRISELQKSHIMLQEQLKNIQNTVARNVDDSALRIIAILDMIGSVKTTTTMNIDDEANATVALIIKKIEKRLIEVLQYWQVQEIAIEGRIEAGKTRVLETRRVAEDIAPGTILQVCRKGYQRANKTIRPADVITAAAEC